ncbi:hypothetical protein D7V97_36225 [Corallococcus sp. CA053C]|uniref:hypothetical protein n=1 Tax=Corallococcus sp. CA053C TaxID=2316732 RepID=UPI000EA3B62F|nr:hypothetical protein [Corallococcus sp. CA053C]RKG96020.1 hypothetical protein D7V97_36225 [Corallococcus sp. CA053C]
MPSSERANLPRWTGQRGFFEIWFVVVLDTGGDRAWWLRYTLFTPAPGAPGEPRATVWAAAFDCASADRPAVALKSIHPASAFTALSPSGVRIGDSELAPGRCHGQVASGEHAIAWDLRISQEGKAPVRREPRGISLLPLPTNVAHVHDDLVFDGTVTVDGERFEVKGAPGLQKHLWGHRRLEELTWLYCPRFREDPDARLEAMMVRAERKAGHPRLAPIYLRTGDAKHTFHELPSMLFTRVSSPTTGELSFSAASATVGMKGRAWCDPRTLVGYLYRDPKGWDVRVAQSDVARCEVELFSRPHPFAPWRPTKTLTSTVGALEFHAPEPVPGVRYIPWDGTEAGPEPELALGDASARETG